VVKSQDLVDIMPLAGAQQLCTEDQEVGVTMDQDMDCRYLVKVIEEDQGLQTDLLIPQAAAVEEQVQLVEMQILQTVAQVETDQRQI
jgi:hypothetical protein